MWTAVSRRSIPLANRQAGCGKQRAVWRGAAQVLFRWQADHAHQKTPVAAKVLEEMVAAGAPEEILYDAKPHIGTDLLRGVVKSSFGEKNHFSGRRGALLRQSDRLSVGRMTACRRFSCKMERKSKQRDVVACFGA